MNNKINKYDLLVILGPTATGKTKLSVKLADQLNGEIISADSRQVYKGMDIRTGKDLDEYEVNKNIISYHLIDILSPMEEYNVAKFQKDFHRIFSEIKNRNKLPILCGGTGFYIKVILKNFKLPMVKPDINLRNKLENWSLNDLIELLEDISPDKSVKIPKDTKRRLIRTIEVEINKGEKEKITSNIKNPLVIGIEFSRHIIRHRITDRLNKRLEEGMIEEVEKLIYYGITYERLDNLGLEYRYISKYLKGELNLNEMKKQLNTAIHRFAKKQMTFFRNMEKNGIKIHWIEEGDYNKTLDIINK